MIIEGQNSNSQKQNFRVFTQSLDGQKMEYNLTRGTTIEQFKVLIARDSSIPLERIRLVFQAKALDNAQKIEEVVSADDQVIHLIARLNVPEPSPQTPVPNTPQAPNTPIITQPPLPFNLQNILGNLPQGLFGQFPAQNVNPLNNQGPSPMVFPVNFGMPNVQPQPPNSNAHGGFTPDVPLRHEPAFGFTVNTPGQNNPGQAPDLMGLINNVTSFFNNSLANANPNTQNQNPAQMQPQPVPQAQNPANDLPLNPTFMNSRQRINDVVSVNNQAITISVASGQESEQFLLDTQTLRIADSLLNVNNSISVEVPRRQETNNSATMTGNYLRSLHDQLYRLLPHLLKVSDILGAEPRIREPEARTQATRVVRNLGRSLGQLSKGLNSLEFLNRFNFGENPSNFSIEVQNPGQPAQNTNQQEQRAEPPQGGNSSGRELTEEERIERDRRSVRNVMNVLSQGVPANSTLRDISRISGEETEETDVINIAFESLSMPDMLALMSGSLEPLNTNFVKIKTSFQNLLIKNQNNEKKMIKELFEPFTSELDKILKKEPEGVVFEGFDPKQIMDEINMEFYPVFKDLFLSEYRQGANEVQFSDLYVKNLKLYFGKIAYEISEGMDEGIDSFHRVFKKGVIDYCSKTIGPGFDFGSIFDMAIWRHIEEGYNIHQAQNEHEEQERRLQNDLKQVREQDEQLEEQGELSEAYKKGRVFE